MMMGIGGGPEGVLAAAALKCLGGDFQGRLHFTNEEEKTRCREMGIEDFDHIYTLEELAKGDVMFAATGVTDGDLLEGVRFFQGGAYTHSSSCAPQVPNRALHQIPAPLRPQTGLLMLMQSRIQIECSFG